MRALPFLAGLALATAVAVVAGWWLGWSALTLVLLAAIVLAAGQVLYLLFVAQMVREEIASRQARGGNPADEPIGESRIPPTLPQHEN